MTKPLTEAEKQQVIALWRAGLSSRAIGKRINRNPITVQRVINAWKATP